MMKLYSKNLPDLHALKKEKARLQKELNGTENKGEKASSDQQKERIASDLLSGIT